MINTRFPISSPHAAEMHQCSMPLGAALYHTLLEDLAICGCCRHQQHLLNQIQTELQLSTGGMCMLLVYVYARLLGCLIRWSPFGKSCECFAVTSNSAESRILPSVQAQPSCTKRSLTAVSPQTMDSTSPSSFKGTGPDGFANACKSENNQYLQSSLNVQTL